MSLLTEYMQKLSRWMFWLLFPGLFLYSSAVGLGVIPAFLGGGYGVFLALTFIVLFPAVMLTSRQLEGVAQIYFALFMGLLICASGYLTFHYFFGNSLHQRPDVLHQWMVLIISWAAIFSVGYFWPKQQSTTEILVLVGMLIIMFLLVVLNLESDKLLFALGKYRSEDYFLSYQGFARSASVTGLVLLAVIRRQYLFWAMSGLLLVTIFLIGSRSELAGLLFVFPILIVYQLAKHPVKTVIIAFVAVIVLGTYLVMNWKEPSLERQMQILNPLVSHSVLKRIKYSSEALQAIAENPISGDFAGHAYFSGGGQQRYTHNLLSSWRQLGLIGFLLYSALLVWPVFGTFHRMIRNPGLLQIDIWRISGAISVFMLVLAIGAKSIFSSILVLSWGVFLAALRQADPIEPKSQSSPIMSALVSKEEVNHPR